MNRSPMIVALAALLLTGPVWAQGETDPANEMAAQYAAEQAAREARQVRLDELMGIMAGEMEAIGSAKSRKDREAVMETHRKHMREAMSLMRGMGGKRMREVMAGHMDAGMKKKMTSADPMHQHKRMAASRPRADMSDAQRLTDLENRLDMMQVMMEALMNDYAER
jgi:hypothetical protein